MFVGRSNAINIAERLGLPSSVVDDARELYGAGSAQIDEVECTIIANLCFTFYVCLLFVKHHKKKSL